MSFVISINCGKNAMKNIISFGFEIAIAKPCKNAFLFFMGSLDSKVVFFRSLKSDVVPKYMIKIAPKNESQVSKFSEILNRPKIMLDAMSIKISEARFVPMMVIKAFLKLFVAFLSTSATTGPGVKIKTKTEKT